METNREACFAVVIDEQSKDPHPNPSALVSHWDACRCSDLPCGLDLFVLDTSVVCGAEPTKRWLGLAGGAAEPARVVILDLEAYRKRALRSTPGWVEYHTKWVNRTLRVKRKAVKMVLDQLEGRA